MFYESQCRQRFSRFSTRCQSVIARARCERGASAVTLSPILAGCALIPVNRSRFCPGRCASDADESVRLHRARASWRSPLRCTVLNVRPLIVLRRYGRGGSRSGPARIWSYLAAADVTRHVCGAVAGTSARAFARSWVLRFFAQLMPDRCAPRDRRGGDRASAGVFQSIRDAAAGARPTGFSTLRGSCLPKCRSPR